MQEEELASDPSPAVASSGQASGECRPAEWYRTAMAGARIGTSCPRLPPIRKLHIVEPS